MSLITFFKDFEQDFPTISFTHCRYRKYLDITCKGNFEPLKMPPTEYAANYHDLQSVSYFETFRCFTTFSFHHKWIDVWLLLTNMVYLNWLMSCQMPMGGLSAHTRKKKLTILRKQEISRNCLNYIEWQPSAQSPRQNKYFANTRRKLPETRN